MGDREWLEKKDYGCDLEELEKEAATAKEKELDSVMLAKSQDTDKEEGASAVAQRQGRDQRLLALLNFKKTAEKQDTSTNKSQNQVVIAHTASDSVSLPMKSHEQAETKEFALPTKALWTPKRSTGHTRPELGNSWGQFRIRITDGDRAAVKKAKEEFERMGGETFRPEIRETYTDQQGRKERTVHEKAGRPMISGEHNQSRTGYEAEVKECVDAEAEELEAGLEGKVGVEEKEEAAALVEYISDSDEVGAAGVDITQEATLTSGDAAVDEARKEHLHTILTTLRVLDHEELAGHELVRALKPDLVGIHVDLEKTQKS